MHASLSRQILQTSRTNKVRLPLLRKSSFGSGTGAVGVGKSFVSHRPQQLLVLKAEEEDTQKDTTTQSEHQINASHLSARSNLFNKDRNMNNRNVENGMVLSLGGARILATDPSSSSSSDSTATCRRGYTVAASLAVGVVTASLFVIHQRRRQERRLVSSLLHGGKEGKQVGNSTNQDQTDSARRELMSLLLTEEDQRAYNYGATTATDANKCIYLDYNATTPIRKQVLSAMLPYLTRHFGNPSSGHVYGAQPKRAVDQAREELATLLLTHDDNPSTKAIDPKELEKVKKGIVFTGCGTEADNLAIYLALESVREGKRRRGEDWRGKLHVVTCNVEHPAVLEYLKLLEDKGEIEVTYLPITPQGTLPPTTILSALRPHNQTHLLTLMLANNESGALLPISTLAAECRKRQILMHTDAAQAVGKVSVDLHKALGGVDMVTLVGHKFGAPKGVAALYVREECWKEGGRGVPRGYGKAGGILVGGGQEGGRRAGTENVPYIVGMGRAASLLTASGEGHFTRVARRMEGLRSRLKDKLVLAMGEGNVMVHGPKDATQRLPNTLSVGLRGVQSGELLKSIGHVVAASAGSACHASGGGVSAVLVAMGIPDEFARGTLRLSVGVDTTEKDVDTAADVIVREAKRQLRAKEEEKERLGVHVDQ